MMKKEAVQHEHRASVLTGRNNLNQLGEERIKSKVGSAVSFEDQAGNGPNMCTYGFSGMMGTGEIQGEGQRTGAEPVMLANTQQAHHHPSHNLHHGGGMGGYSHVLSDPMIQESLSPFFQPYGIDVSRFPMTSPPIFQSSLASFNAPPRSRRISISNGQIGQMGQMADNEDIIESIHDVQPPPMPQRRMLHTNGKPQTHTVSALSFPPEYAGHRTASSQDSHLSAGTAVDIPQREYQPQGLPEANHESVGSVELHTADFSALSVNVGNGPPSRAESIQARNDAEAMPGTAAWKRARLLERNRIAASKCRQRKKIAQQQLQKGVDLLARENKVMKRKLEYYQKLVSKFKIFIELHMDSCGGNKDSLKVVEELLKIDHGLNENDVGVLEVKDLQDDPKLIDIN